MTEKRFILCNKTTDSNVWDTLEKQYYSWEFMVSLLNYLNDENKELKKRINEWKSKYTNRGIAITKAVEDLYRTEEVYLADFDICKRITEYEWEFNNE